MINNLWEFNKEIIVRLIQAKYTNIDFKDSLINSFRDKLEETKDDSINYIYKFKDIEVRIYIKSDLYYKELIDIMYDLTKSHDRLKDITKDNSTVVLTYNKDNILINYEIKYLTSL